MDNIVEYNFSATSNLNKCGAKAWYKHHE